MREPLTPTGPQGVVDGRKKFLTGIRTGGANALGGGVTGATGAPKLPHRSIEQPAGVFPWPVIRLSLTEPLSVGSGKGVGCA